MNFFEGLKTARACLLALSTHGAIAQRIRMLPEAVVVEVDRPLNIEGEIQIKGGYAAIEFSGCSVAWKVSEEL